MKKLFAFLALAVAAFAAEPVPQTGFYVDLYGNLFKDGVNLNRKVSDYARDPANYADGPALDAAITDVALRGREFIAEQLAAKDAEKQAAITAAETARDQAIALEEAEKVAAIAAAEQARDAAIAANAEALATAQATAAAKTQEVETLTAQLAEKTAALDTANADIASKAAEITAKDATIAERDAAITAKDAQIATLQARVAELEAAAQPPPAESPSP